MNKEISLKQLLTILLLFIGVILSVFILGIPYRTPNLINICKISTINLNSSCLLYSLIGLKYTYLINWLFLTIVITVLAYIKTKKTGKYFKLSLFLIFTVLLILNQSLLPVGGNKLLSRKTYTDLDSLKKSFDFRKYPTTPFFEPYTNIDLNPMTGNKLEYKKFEDYRGYGCCGAPSYTFIHDKDKNIFWIKFYQASLSSRHESTYGPFILKEE